MLFGSQAKGTATHDSDIDICVVMNAANKRRVLADMYYQIQSELPLDIFLYIPAEWEDSIRDTTSFAYVINREGLVLL